jgi:hypothetical protein
MGHFWRGNLVTKSALCGDPGNVIASFPVLNNHYLSLPATVSRGFRLQPHADASAQVPDIRTYVIDPGHV